MDEKETILERGQPSISDKYREDTKGYRVILPESFIEYIKRRGKEEKITAAEYLRRLIATDMRQNE